MLWEINWRQNAALFEQNLKLIKQVAKLEAESAAAEKLAAWKHQVAQEKHDELKIDHTDTKGEVKKHGDTIMKATVVLAVFVYIAETAWSTMSV